MGIGSLGGTVFFQVGLCIPLQIMNNLYVNPTDLFNDIFLVYKVRWMERNQLLGWLWHIWFKSDSVKTKKQKKTNSAAQQGSKHDNMMNERREPSTGQKNRNTLADSNYFYTGINTMHKFLCMSNTICVHVMCVQS